MWPKVLTREEIIKEQLEKAIGVIVIRSGKEYYTFENPFLVFRYRYTSSCSITVRYTDDEEVEEYFYDDYDKAFHAFVLTYKVSMRIKDRVIKLFGR
jgi:hypothetical protein